VLDSPGHRLHTTRERGERHLMRSSAPSFTAHSAAREQSDLQKTLIKSAKDVFAGTCGGITVTLLGHPFDTVKVLLQTQPAKNPIYSGPIDAATKVIKAEGFGGLYKGVTSPLAGQMFFRAGLFFGYARAKEVVGVSPDDPLSYFKAGSLAWLAGTMFESPIDLFKSQWQTQLIKAKQNPNYKPPYATVAECVKASFRYSGIRGPYQALGATMTRNLPAGAIYFGVFEVRSIHWSPYDPVRVVNAVS
jgi:solute carrier family 25 carnitine/acylcarnitine transporter 20/29